MTFQEAIGWMKRGEKIKRSHWKTMYVFTDNNRILMCQGIRRPWYYSFNSKDIFSNDWLIANVAMFEEDE